jgi:uncharacterized protein YfiM (DUF2279 family)
MLSFRRLEKTTILIILFLFLCSQHLSAGEQSKSLETYFKSFALGKEADKSGSWFSADKGYHIVGSMICTTFLGELSRRRFDITQQKAQVFGAGTTFSIGLAKEIYDSAKPNNIFSWKDLSANCVGIILGVFLLGVH